MHPLHHIASLVLNTPLLCTPAHAETVCAVLGQRIGVDSSEMAISGERRQPGSPYMTSGNTLVIPVMGSLTHRQMAMDVMSGQTSYESMQAQIEDAMENGGVSRIALDMDTPGGMVAGVFDFADYLLDQRGRKPMMAIARDKMCSAGYLIGSSVDQVVTTQTGQVGSIGVVMMHLDRSQQLEQNGIKPTLIYAGRDKVLGNDVTPLSDSDVVELSAEVNQTYQMFVDAVVARRDLSAQAVRATEAGIFRGQAAVDAGLADEVGTLEVALEQMSEGGPKVFPVSTMSTSQIQEEDMERDEILAEGATNERQRIDAILSSPEAEGRQSLASHFALKTDMAADAAIAALKASPREAASIAPLVEGEGFANSPTAGAPAAGQATAIAHVHAVLGADAPQVAADGQSAKAEPTAAEKKSARIAELRGTAREALGKPTAATA